MPPRIARRAAHAPYLCPRIVLAQVLAPFSRFAQLEEERAKGDEDKGYEQLEHGDEEGAAGRLDDVRIASDVDRDRRLCRRRSLGGC